MKLRSYDAKVVDGVTTGFFAVEATDDELAALLVHVAMNGQQTLAVAGKHNFAVMDADKMAAEFKASMERADEELARRIQSASTAAPFVVLEPVVVAAEKPKRTRAPRAAAASEPAPAVTNPDVALPLIVAPLGSPAPLVDGNGAPVQVKVAETPQPSPPVVATAPPAPAAAAKSAAPSNGTIPKEVMEAPRHREVVQHLKDALGWERQPIIDWCVSHQAAVPALARLPAEELVDRIDRICNIFQMK
jgi:hypothetical protein